MKSDTIQLGSKDARSKQPQIIEALTKMARNLGPGAKLPTARELARTMGVASATLMRCIDALERRGVLNSRRGSGIYVDSRVMQKRIALVFGENIFSRNASEFGSLILERCAIRAAQCNERFSFFIDHPGFVNEVNDQPTPALQDLVDALADGMIDGVIVLGGKKQDAWLSDQGVPVVSLNYAELSPKVNAVSFDYRKLIEMGVDSLVNAGCRTIGLLSPLLIHKDMFQSTMEERGLVIHNEWMVLPEKSSPGISAHHVVFGEKSAKQFLRQCGWLADKGNKGSLPDGLLITDDTMARGILPILSSHGVDIGHGLKVCTHGNNGSRVLAEWESKIIQVKFNPEDLAIALFDMLEDLMAGKPYSCQYLISPMT